MDDAAPPAAPERSSFWGIAGALVAAVLVVAIGVTIPLQVASLKKEKAEATAVPPEIHVRRPPQYGVASWYGDHEAGKLTASGAVFEPNGLTAAHRWLPLGTKVRVTRLGTKAKQSTIVTINDRGPYIGGRIIDLSPAAARKLAMVDKGLARVRIDIVTEPSPAQQMIKRAGRKAHPPAREEMAEKPPKDKKKDIEAAKPQQPDANAPQQEAEAPTANATAVQPAEARQASTDANAPEFSGFANFP